MTTRALEAYWVGFTAWCLDVTDRAPRRHVETLARVRALVVEIGESIVAMRHRRDADAEVRERLDRLAWQLDLAEQRRALGRSELARCGDAMQCVRGLLPPPRPVRTRPAEDPGPSQ